MDANTPDCLDPEQETSKLSEVTRTEVKIPAQPSEPAESADPAAGATPIASGPASETPQTAQPKSRAARTFARSLAEHKHGAFAGIIVLAAALIGTLVWWWLSHALPSSVQVIKDFDAVALEEGLTNSLYASNTGYVVDGVELTGLDKNGASGATALVTSTYHNDSFDVRVQSRVDYERTGNQWAPTATDVLQVEATPREAPEAEAVAADIAAILSKVAPHDGTSIERLYDGGTFEVTKRSLSADKTTATVLITAHKMGALYEYEGIITAEFSFVPGKAKSDAGSWQLTGASANDEAFQSSAASVQGSWKGSFESTATSALFFSTGVCNAGEAYPISLTVTSYDAETGQMTCDITFVAHGHGALDATQSTSDGDALVRLTGARLELDPSTLEGSLSSAHTQALGSYTAEGLSSSTDKNTLEWELAFKNDGGIWRVVVQSGLATDAPWGIGKTTFTDTYTLARG